MLVNCGGYKSGNLERNLALGEIRPWLDKAGAGAFAWLALKDPQADELESAGKELSLPRLAMEDALHGGQRAKIEEYGPSVFLAMHQVELNAANELIRGEVYVFAAPGYAVSVRLGNATGFSAVRERAQAEPELLSMGPAFVVYALLDVVVDRYFPVLEHLEKEFEHIEGRIFSGSKPGEVNRRALVEDLWRLKDRVSEFRHDVFPLLEATGKIQGGRVPPLFTGSDEYFRDVRDHLSRIIDAVDRLRDSITAAMQSNLSLVAIEEGTVTKRLAAGAAIFAATTLMAGIWGMNFKFMPELEWKAGYPIALGLIAGVALFLRYRFKKAGWM